MPIIDIILASLIVYGIVRGLFRGLFVEVAGLLALVVGVYGAIHFSNYAGEFLVQHIDWNKNTINVTAFIVTFVLIVLAISLAGKALTKLASFVFLGALNKILGGLFGGAKVTLILSVLLLLLNKTQLTKRLISDEDKATSIFYEPVQSLAPLIMPNLIDNQKDVKGSSQN